MYTQLYNSIVYKWIEVIQYVIRCVMNLFTDVCIDWNTIRVKKVKTGTIIPFEEDELVIVVRILGVNLWQQLKRGYWLECLLWHCVFIQMGIFLFFYSFGKILDKVIHKII